MKNRREHGLVNEFKTFIAKGSVVDLAVGLIIGTAFSAIVNGFVNFLFKPLINTIPMGELTGLKTMLIAKDSAGVATTDPALMDMAKSIYIDWGSFIMTIVNFFITAFILFFFIKAINSFREKLDKAKDDIANVSAEFKEKIKSYRKNDDRDNNLDSNVANETKVDELVVNESESIANKLIENTELQAIELAEDNLTTDQLLQEILKELKKQNNSSN